MEFVKKHRWILTIGALLLFSLVYACLAKIMAKDVYWHLKIGEDFLWHGLNPFNDNYSIDFLGQHVRGVPIIFDALVAIFYNIFGGELGLQFIRLFFWFLPFFFLLYWTLKNRVHWFDYLFASTLLVSGMTYRRFARPELFSFFMVMVFSFILIAKEKQKRYLYWLLGLQLLWTNFHMTSVFGYVLLAAIYLEYLRDFYWKRRQDLKYLFFILGMGVLTLGVGFLNPSIQHPLLEVLQIDDRWSFWIKEFLPSSFSDLSTYRKSFWALVVLTFLGLIYKRSYGALLVLATLSYKGWTMNKLFPHMAVLVSVLGIYLLIQFREILKAKKQSLRLGFLAIVLVFISFNVYELGYNIFYVYKPTQELAVKDYPTDVIDYLKTIDGENKAMNSYAMGGYLIYHLGPEMKFYIDGRTNILFPYDFFVDYIKLARTTGYLAEHYKEKKYDYVIGTMSDNNRIIDTTLETGLYGIDYIGSWNAVLVPIEKSEFPLSTFYFRFPQCMNIKAFNAMASEIKACAKENGKYLSVESLLPNCTEVLSGQR